MGAVEALSHIVLWCHFQERGWIVTL